MFVTVRLAIAAAVAAGVAAVLPGRAGVAVGILNGALLLALAYDVWTAPAPARLGIAREVPVHCAVGRPDEVVLRVHNPTARLLALELRDASPPSLHRDPVRHRATLAPGVRSRLGSRIRPLRRGVHSLGPITVRTSGPLRLGGRQAALPIVSEIKVYPPLPGRAEVELRLERARLLSSGERSAAIRGGGSEFDSLREYHPDDEFRRINWRATARATKPISNTFREERNQQVLLLLDAGRLMAGTIAGVTRFEHAIDASVAVAELAARVGDHVGMVAFARDLVSQVSPRSGRSQARRVLEALFAVEPTLDAPNYARAFSTLLAKHRKRALLVVLTELASEAALESLLHAMPVLLGRHLVVVGSVVDPDVRAAAEGSAATEEQVYSKAAAAASLEARERAAIHLRRMGAVVVDCPPGELAGRVADEYLRIKAFGRL